VRSIAETAQRVASQRDSAVAFISERSWLCCSTSGCSAAISFITSLSYSPRASSSCAARVVLRDERQDRLALIGRRRAQDRQIVAYSALL
jgi:hypothetical protein